MLWPATLRDWDHVGAEAGESNLPSPLTDIPSPGPARPANNRPLWLVTLSPKRIISLTNYFSKQ